MKITSLLVVGFALCAGSLSYAQDAPAAPATEISAAEQSAMKQYVGMLMSNTAAYLAEHPELVMKMSDPAWVGSPEFFDMQISTMMKTDPSKLPAVLKENAAVSLATLQQLKTAQGEEKEKLQAVLKAQSDQLPEDLKKAYMDAVSAGQQRMTELMKEYLTPAVTKELQANPDVSQMDVLKKALPGVLKQVSAKFAEEAK